MTNDILNEYKHNQEVKERNLDEKVKVAIIGTGWIAGAHIYQYQQMEDVEVVALADLVPGRAQEFAEKYGLTNARCYLSDEELLAAEKDNLDAVSICTYNTQHAPCAIHALDAGINVMLEKPLQFP